MIRIALSSLALLSVVACGGTTSDGDTGAGGSGSGDEPSDKSLHLGSPSGDAGSGATSDDWTAIQLCPSDAESDSFSLSEGEIDGDSFTVRVSHSAGCASHSYALCYEDAWAESYPVQVGLQFIHDSGGETCEAEGSQELTFDLTPLKEAYIEGYRSESGDISLGLDGESHLYSFDEGDGGSIGIDPEPNDLLSWEEIDAKIDAANTCEVVEDCQGIPTTPCNTAFIGKDADRSSLEADISARNAADGNDLIACPAICACGVLTCDAGKCVARADQQGCGEPGAGEQSVCL